MSEPAGTHTHEHDDPAFAEGAIELLRSRGYRITRQRRAVIALLSEACDPLMPYDIKDRLDRSGTPVDTVSVYRILSCLEENGIVHKIHTSGGYVKCHLHPDADACHHYLLCRACGRVEEIPCSGLEAIERDIREAAGFRVEAHNIELTGVCAACG